MPDGFVNQPLQIDPITKIKTKIKKAIHDTKKFLSTLEFTSQTNVTADMGMQAGFEFNVDELVNIKLEGGYGVNKIFEGKVDAFHVDKAKIDYGFFEKR